MLVTGRDREPAWAHQLEKKAPGLGGPVLVAPPGAGPRDPLGSAPPLFGGQAVPWEEGPSRGAAPSEAGWLGSGSRGRSSGFQQVLSLTAGRQGPGGLRETVQSSPSRSE